jgi:hypothetical protein
MRETVPGAIVATIRQERSMLCSTSKLFLLDWTVPMKALIGLLMVGAVALGISLDRRKRGERGRVSRPDINRWEEEGGAVPVSGQQTAAQVEPTVTG